MKDLKKSEMKLQIDETVRFEKKAVLESIVSMDAMTPTYDELTGVGTFKFSQMVQNIEASLNVLGMFSMTVSKQSTFYVLFSNKTKDVGGVLYGIGIYIVMKVTNQKGKVNISCPYDISAAAQLNLLDVELDVKTFGISPKAQNLFYPDKMSDIDIESAKYFDSVVANFKNLNNDNTAPEVLPEMFISLKPFKTGGAK